MEIFKKIGLTAVEVRKISPEMESAVIQLEELTPFIESGKAPSNIKSVYDSILNEIERTLFSKEFKQAASKSGVKTITTVNVDEKIEVANVPKVKTFQEIIAERANKSAVKPIIEKTEVEEAEVEKTTKTPTFQEIIERRKQEENQPIQKEPATTTSISTSGSIELQGFIIKGDKSGTFTARDRITMMLAYGGYDGIMSMYSGSNGYNFLMKLPKSLGFVVFTLPLSIQDAQFYTNTQDVWNTYVENASAEIAVLSRDKEELEQLSKMVGETGSTKIQGKIISANLSSEHYNEFNFDVVNDEYSRDMAGVVTYEVMVAIKRQWNGGDIENSTAYNLSRKENIPYGVRLTDYEYATPEMYYYKGGSTIVVKNKTFYVPKGIKKSELFCEAGVALKDDNIKTRDFKKDIALAKDFQNKTTNLDKAEICRIIGSQDESLLVANTIGKSFLISTNSYNYFKKYYGVNIELRSAGEVVAVYDSGNVVGLITATKVSNSSVISLFDLGEIKSELRSINIEAFDFMISKAVAAADEVETEIEDIDKGTDETAELKAEFESRISFLESMAKMSKEADEPQELIDELNMEIDSLKMIHKSI